MLPVLKWLTKNLEGKGVTSKHHTIQSLDFLKKANGRAVTSPQLKRQFPLKWTGAKKTLFFKRVKLPDIETRQTTKNSPNAGFDMHLNLVLLLHLNRIRGNMD